jgi:hypothetical protein
MEIQDNYVVELNSMLEKAISRMKTEKPDFIVYTASIWTDKSAKASAINFDSKENSLRMVEKSNEYDKKYYDKYIAEGDLKLAELFKPQECIRFCNPADFELSDFEGFEHSVVPTKWHSILVKFGKVAFEKIVSELNVDVLDFELGINSTKDWYYKTWNIRDCAVGNEVENSTLKEI